MAEQPRAPKSRPRTTKDVLEEFAPWKKPDFEPADASALQALARGDCPGHLQQRALNFIIYKLCGTYDFPYRPGTEGARDTDMALGKMWVGQQIVNLLKIRVKPNGEQS